MFLKALHILVGFRGERAAEGRRGSVKHIYLKKKKVLFGLKAWLHLNPAELSRWHGPKASPLGLHVSDPRGSPGRAPESRRGDRPPKAGAGDVFTARPGPREPLPRVRSTCSPTLSDGRDSRTIAAPSSPKSRPAKHGPGVQRPRGHRGRVGRPRPLPREWRRPRSWAEGAGKRAAAPGQTMREGGLGARRGPQSRGALPRRPFIPARPRALAPPRPQEPPQGEGPALRPATLLKSQNFPNSAN